MKATTALLLAAVLLTVPASGQSVQLTAYQALRTVEREKGGGWLDRLVELRGVDGGPQPVRWLLTFRDKNARGGVREFALTAQGVSSERTPVRVAGSGASSVMGSRSLNLDSSGAFAAANKQAAAAKVGFHSLNYLLQNSQGAPVWLVQLYDEAGLEVGKMKVSAQSGGMVSRLRTPLGPAASPAVTAAAPVTSRPTAPTGGTFGDRWVEGGGLVGHVSRWGERSWDATTNTAVRVGDSINAFFIGRPEQPAPAPRN